MTAALTEYKIKIERLQALYQATKVEELESFKQQVQAEVKSLEAQTNATKTQVEALLRDQT
ncbi:hypothetical protein WMY93_026914, partial [Mugilogobius chulae]